MRAARRIAFGIVFGAAIQAASETPTVPRLLARVYDSGFPEAHDTYNGIGAASDGRVYYVLSSERHDVAAQMFVLDPASGRPRRASAPRGSSSARRRATTTRRRIPRARRPP